MTTSVVPLIQHVEEARDVLLGYDDLISHDEAPRVLLQSDDIRTYHLHREDRQMVRLDQTLEPTSKQSPLRARGEVVPELVGIEVAVPRLSPASW